MQLPMRKRLALATALLAVCHSFPVEQPMWKPGGDGPWCLLKDIAFARAPDSSTSLPVYAVGGHTGPVRHWYDKLLQNKTGWKEACPIWFDGVPGEYQFLSQFGQDWWLYQHVFWHYPAGYLGTMVEAAAFNPVKESNSYFFEKCMGWKGVLVEPQPQNYHDFLGLRTFALAPWCVSDSREMLKFQTFTGVEKHASGLGKVAREAGAGAIYDVTVERASKAKGALTEITVPCAPLQDIFDHFEMQHIDYLSLDVEGSEMRAVKSIDFSRTTIDFITVEGSPIGTEAANWLMKEKGYELVHGTQLDADGKQGTVSHADPALKLGSADFLLVRPGYRGFRCNVGWDVGALLRPNALQPCPDNSMRPWGCEDSKFTKAGHTLKEKVNWRASHKIRHAG
jgi:FkbM family methyltransferase